MTERTLRSRLLDAFTHSGPGYDLTPREEPDDPAAWALAKHISEHRISTIQNAFRYLGWNVRFTVEPVASEVSCTGECDPETGAFVHSDKCAEGNK